MRQGKKRKEPALKDARLDGNSLVFAYDDGTTTRFVGFGCEICGMESDETRPWSDCVDGRIVSKHDVCHDHWNTLYAEFAAHKESYRDSDDPRIFKTVLGNYHDASCRAGGR